jgi:hypothetical protein
MYWLWVLYRCDELMLHDTAGQKCRASSSRNFHYIETESQHFVIKGQSYFRACDVKAESILRWPVLPLNAKNLLIVVSQLRRIVPCLSMGGAWAWFQATPRGICGNKMALGQFLLGILRFSPVTILPSILHAHIPFTCHRRFLILRRPTGCIDWQNISVSLGMSLCALQSSDSEKLQIIILFRSLRCSLN